MSFRADIKLLLDYNEEDEFADFVEWINDDGLDAWDQKKLGLTDAENDRLRAYVEAEGLDARVDIVDVIAASTEHIYGAITRLRNALARRMVVPKLTDRQKRFLAGWYRTNISKARDE